MLPKISEAAQWGARHPKIFEPGKECPPQVMCHLLPEQFGLHQCGVCSALHGNDLLVLGLEPYCGLRAHCVSSGLLWQSSLRHRQADTRGALLSHTYSGRPSLRTNGNEVHGVQTISARCIVTHACSMLVAGTWTRSPAFFYAGHYPLSNYGPTTPSLGVSDLNTLVDSLLHQMHLMPLTWFNGARLRRLWYNGLSWTHEETDAHHVFLFLRSPLIPLPQTSTLASGLDMCKVCTEAVHSVALWTRVTLQVWACVKVCTAVEHGLHYRFGHV